MVLPLSSPASMLIKNPIWRLVYIYIYISCSQRAEVKVLFDSLPLLLHSVPIYIMLFTSFKRYKYIFFIIVTSADMIFYSITIRTLFSEDDWKLVQLVLTLFRNVLAIQEITLTQKASGEATHLLFLADSFLELMFQENVMDIILVLTQNIDEPSGYLKEENLLLMEIYHYVFLGRDPGLIARASNKGSKVFLLFVIFFSFCEYYSVFWMPLFLSTISGKKLKFVYSIDTL